MAGHDYTEHREPAPHAWAYGAPDDDAWPEPFDGDHAVSVSIDDKGEQPVETRFGESRVDAALRFLEGRDLSGAGCARATRRAWPRPSSPWTGRRSIPCASSMRAASRIPCLPAFGVNGGMRSTRTRRARTGPRTRGRSAAPSTTLLGDGVRRAGPAVPAARRRHVPRTGWNPWMVAEVCVSSTPIKNYTHITPLRSPSPPPAR